MTIKIVGDAHEQWSPGEFVDATLVLTCGHHRRWELALIDDGGRVYGIRRPPHGLWCLACERVGSQTTEEIDEARRIQGRA